MRILRLLAKLFKKFLATVSTWCMAKPSRPYNLQFKQTSENLSAAESRIRDIDLAKEMMEQTKNAILAQDSQAMLAQANQ